MSDTYQGACFCGAVTFEVEGDPAVMGYCHCGDCATWAAAPINSFAFWPAGTVRITQGEDNIGTYNKTENVYRKFCKTCGGHVISELPGFNFVEVYPNTVPDLVHEPTLHVFYESKTISVNDGLPKFKDLPADFGGSGDMLPD